MYVNYSTVTRKVCLYEYILYLTCKFTAYCVVLCCVVYNTKLYAIPVYDYVYVCTVLNCTVLGKYVYSYEYKLHTLLKTVLPSGAVQ